MPEFLTVTIDKFTFRIAADRWYTREGLWALPKAEQIRVGLSDYVQQRSGDIAFVEIKPIGTQLAVGDEIAALETIKVNVAMSSPVNGKVLEVNTALETAPEAINQDPYEAGWLAAIASSDWESDRSRLLDAAAYFDLVKREAAEETKGQ